ncbi:hypothetical protein ACJX0J_034743 [Zea mays]
MINNFVWLSEILRMFFKNLMWIKLIWIPRDSLRYIMFFLICWNDFLKYQNSFTLWLLSDVHTRILYIIVPRELDVTVLELAILALVIFFIFLQFFLYHTAVKSIL